MIKAFRSIVLVAVALFAFAACTSPKFDPDKLTDLKDEKTTRELTSTELDFCIDQIEAFINLVYDTPEVKGSAEYYNKYLSSYERRAIQFAFDAVGDNKFQMTSSQKRRVEKLHERFQSIDD